MDFTIIPVLCVGASFIQSMEASDKVGTLYFMTTVPMFFVSCSVFLLYITFVPFSLKRFKLSPFLYQILEKPL